MTFTYSAPSFKGYFLFFQVCPLNLCITYGTPCSSSIFSQNFWSVFFQITYSGTKSYTEKGERKQLSHIRDVKLDAVSPGLQSHTLTGLVPHTTYKIELSAVNSMGEGPSTTLTLKTDTGKPPALTRPVIIEEKSSNEYLPMKLEAASERNGPIR